MKSWLKSAIIAFFSGATLVLARGSIENDRENSEIKVFPGSSHTFFCCLKVNATGRCHVSWYFKPSGKNQTDMNTEKNIYNWTEKPCNLTNICNNKNYTLSNIKESNVGWYYCKVSAEIPILQVHESKKVKVMLENLMEKTTVQSQTSKTQVVEKPDVHEDWWMWISIGVSSFILIVIALLVICAAQRRLCNRDIAEEPIYVNTHMMNPSPRLMPPPVSSSQGLRTLSSARRQEEKKQRHKH